MSLVRSSLSRKPEKKGLTKFFLMCCEGQNCREIKISAKKSYKWVHFDYLLVLKIVFLLIELFSKCMLSA